MAKKNKKEQKFIYEKDLDNYYDLKQDAVERLVNADDDNVPEVGEAELKQYRSSKLSKIPMWIRALFVKFWFNGAVCFFFLWGLSMFIPDLWDQMLVVGLAMGVVTDLLVNNVFRFMAEEPNGNDKWMMIPQKKFWTLFVNILYAMAVFAIEVMLYHGINILFRQGEDEIVLGVEPFLFGLFYLIIDMAFIGIKNLIVRIVKDAKVKTQQKVTAQKVDISDVGDIFTDKNGSQEAEQEEKSLIIVKQVTPSQGKKKKKKK